MVERGVVGHAYPLKEFLRASKHIKVSHKSVGIGILTVALNVA
jgi:hypothetical protein